MTLQVGEQAPNFALKNQHGETVRLSQFRGKQAVVVVFYPWAFSGVCGGELHDLREAVLGLPARYREAVVLRHVQGFNYDEIAEVLGVPAGTAKSDVHRGLAILKENLR